MRSWASDIRQADACGTQVRTCVKQVANGQVHVLRSGRSQLLSRHINVCRSQRLKVTDRILGCVPRIMRVGTALTPPLLSLSTLL